MDIEFGHMTKRELCIALSAVAECASRDALDEDMLARLDPRSYVVGRADMANRILQLVAAKSDEARA